MTAVDTGPLIALLDDGDRYHHACAAVIDELDLPFVTTLPVLTEVMYFLDHRFGWRGQERLWRMVEQGHVVLAHVGETELTAMHSLMAKYQDAPMDFADASVVAMLDALNLRTVFTTDGHFRAYRLADRRALKVIPSL